MKISRIILIILLFFVFFEIGLFSSYTLATGEVPDPGELINMQQIDTNWLISYQRWRMSMGSM